MSLRFVVTFAVSLAAATPLLAQELPPPMPGAPLLPPPGVPFRGPLPSTPPMPGFHAFRGPLPELGYGFQDREAELKERQAELKERQKEKEREARERESEIYDRGMEATYEGRYERAVTSFARLIEMKGARADAALYWKAYAHNKLGQRADALAAVAELTKSHPNSRYLKDAKALEVEVRNASGQGVRPENQADEDLKIIALQSLQHTAPEQAVPMLENVLKGTASPRVKERALYVLALSNNAKAREALIAIAKGSSTPELQNRAIQYLGVHGGRESRAALADVYASSTDVDIKRRILRAFMVAGERDRLLSAAQTEKDESLRATAVEQLGVMGAHDALWTLYQKEASVDVKRQIIRAMFVGGNSTRLIELAKTEQNPELRLAAVRNLGIMGSKTAGTALVELYSTDKDPAVRKAALEALFIQGNSTGLVALARKEQDPQMKRAIVERLSHMNDDVARAYMLELLK